LLEVVGRDDKVSILKYDASWRLSPISSKAMASLTRLQPTFHAILLGGELLRRSSGDVKSHARRHRRKAIILISTGVDTFSKANFQQVLEAARSSATPIYTIGLVHLVERESAVYGATAPFARIDWSTAEKQLETLAKVSEGVPTLFNPTRKSLRFTTTSWKTFACGM